MEKRMKYNVGLETDLSLCVWLLFLSISMQAELTKFWREDLFKLRTKVGTVQIRMSCPKRTMDDYFLILGVITQSCFFSVWVQGSETLKS